MKKILAIAKNTYREAIRSKLFVLLTIFSLSIIFFSKIISMLAVRAELKVITDVGLATIELFAILTSILIAVNLFYKEKDKKTFYNIFSKPVTREQFIIGKFIGISFTMFISIVFLGAAFILYLYLLEGNLGLYLVPQFFLFYLEANIMISFSLFFSSLSTPILSSLFAIGVFLIGNFSPQLITHYVEKAHGALKVLLEIIYYFLPNLNILNYKNQLVYTKTIPMHGFEIGIIYGIDYALLILILTLIIFRKKEIL